MNWWFVHIIVWGGVVLFRFWARLTALWMGVTWRTEFIQYQWKFKTVNRAMKRLNNIFALPWIWQTFVLNTAKKLDWTTKKILSFSEPFAFGDETLRPFLHFLRFRGPSNYEWVSVRCPSGTESKFWLQNTHEKVKSNLYNQFELQYAMYHFFWVTLYMSE